MRLLGVFLFVEIFITIFIYKQATSWRQILQTCSYGHSDSYSTFVSQLSTPFLTY